MLKFILFFVVKIRKCAYTILIKTINKGVVS
nr:MAG TPA: hypothetical protein [Caudoviricetes sp.]